MIMLYPAAKLPIRQQDYSRRMPFLVDGFGIPFKDDPQKVMFFSAEDSYEYTLKRRLRKKRCENGEYHVY